MESRELMDALSRLALDQKARSEFAGKVEVEVDHSPEFITEQIALTHRSQHSDEDDLQQLIDLAKGGALPYVVELLICRALSPLERDSDLKGKLVSACFQAPSGLNIFCIRRLLLESHTNTKIFQASQEGFKDHVKAGPSRKTFGMLLKVLSAIAKEPTAPTAFFILMPVLAPAIMESTILAQFLGDLHLPTGAEGPVFRVLREAIRKEAEEFRLKRAREPFYPVERACQISWYILCRLEELPENATVRKLWLLKLLAETQNVQLIQELHSMAHSLRREQYPRPIDQRVFDNLDVSFPGSES
jgi:hypothetical protein